MSRKHIIAAILCKVRLDRIRLLSWCKRGLSVPKIKGFSVIRDFRPRPRRGEKPRAYARIRELKSNHSATTVYWLWDRQKGWFKHWYITLVADDLRGISAPEIWTVFKHCRFLKLSLFELAFDFHPSSGVDESFIRQHALFGKSRFRPDRGGPRQLRFGSRYSGKLVRCYQKESVNAFRVEVELHSSLLPKASRNFREIIESRWPEIADAGFSIVPRHCRFVKLRFNALGRYLRQRFGEHGDVVLQRTRARAAESIHSALAYLRHRGVHNPHRFLQPMTRINAAIEHAVEDWARNFLRPCHELDEMIDQTRKSQKEK